MFITTEPNSLAEGILLTLWFLNNRYRRTHTTDGHGNVSAKPYQWLLKLDSTVRSAENTPVSGKFFSCSVGGEYAPNIKSQFLHLYKNLY
jgi:hypothetical protein